MGYLICDKCGGHYTLKEGESPEDFVGCPCGGKLKYLESLEEPSNITKPVNESFSKGYLRCIECLGFYTLKEGESPEDFVGCPCGGKLKYLESLEEPSNIPKHVNKLSSKINEIIIDLNSKIKRIMTFSRIYNKLNKPESSLGGSWSQNRKIAVSSVFFMVIIFIGIGGLMFTNTSTQLVSPATEYYDVMVNATNDESTFKTVIKGKDQSNLYYTPYNETIPITGTWNTVNQVIDYKYTPANSWNTDIELQENKSNINNDEQENETINLTTIDQIGADEAKFEDRQGVCSNLDCFLSLGYGDCWADSYYLFDRCKRAGIKVRIVCSNNKLHRWVQIYKEARWQDWEYTKYNSKHFGGASCYRANCGYYVLPGYSYS